MFMLCWPSPGRVGGYSPMKCRGWSSFRFGCKSRIIVSLRAFKRKIQLFVAFKVSCRVHSKRKIKHWKDILKLEPRRDWSPFRVKFKFSNREKFLTSTNKNSFQIVSYQCTRFIIADVPDKPGPASHVDPLKALHDGHASRVPTKAGRNAWQAFKSVCVGG